MQRTSLQTLRIILSLLTIVVLNVGLFIQASAQPSIQNGILDLRNYDFVNSDYVTLKGNWEFIGKNY